MLWANSELFFALRDGDSGCPPIRH